MSAIAAAIGIGAAGVIGSSVMGSRAANKAADAQSYASDQAIAAQRSEFDKSIELLRPYTDVGAEAIGMQRAFTGLGTPEDEQAQIDAVMGSPEYAALISSGEEGILQNAAATGGLRGGNTQKALSEYRPSILAGLLERRYNRLGGLAGMGQASASQQAYSGNQLGTNIAGQLNQQGMASAQNQLSKGAAWSSGISGVAQSVGQFGGMGGFGGGGQTGFAQAPNQSQVSFANMGGMGGYF